MSSVAGATAVSPPWEHPQFLTEEGLRAAQEYYFQTHATHSRMIAQGRNAQGIAKSFIRRKLAREMGEDYKMYTGMAIGQASAPEEMASLGIRGELNALLKHIYLRIAPSQAITSPMQEDVTILKHPHGALEVCYAMVFYYGSLMRQYASFASNRRKVLKSIMDEELFKWIWRMVIGFMMLPEEAKLSQEPSSLAAGLAFVPQDKAREPLGGKLHEIGMFLLSKTLAESHLRVPLCYYYVVYLRQLQTLLALHTGRQELDEVYSMVNRRVQGEPVEHPLVAVDALLNGKGSSEESFGDVLPSAEELPQHIPAEELAFIAQFEDFGNPERLGQTLKRLVPDVRREQVEGEEASLMPLLLALRVMPNEVREAALAALPVPLLNMLRNRLGNAARDIVSDDLAESIRGAMDARKGQGYQVQSTSGTSKAAVATSVRVAPPKGGQAAPSGAEKAAIARREAAAAQRAAERAQTQRPQDEAAAAGRPAASAKAPEQAPQRSAPQAAPQPGTGAPDAKPRRGTGYMEEPSVLAWRTDGERIATISLSAKELLGLTGAEVRFLVPWVVFTLRTGQVFGLAPDRVSKERVEQVVQALRRQSGGVGGELSREQLEAVLVQAQGGSQTKLLLALVKAAGTQRFLRPPEGLAPGLAALGRKFGTRLMDFLRNPNDESFAAERSSLTNEERQALVVLQRVARAQ